ncbi:MAG: EAL domain-containing protein [Lachnospiraceae bacterium]
MKRMYHIFLLVSVFLGILWLSGLFPYAPVYADTSAPDPTPSLSFTEEELDYIKSAEPIRIALSATRQNLSYYNQKTGQYDGITYALLSLIEEKTGLTFEYIDFPTGVRAVDFLESGNATLFAPMMDTEIVSISDRLVKLGPCMESTLSLIGRRDFLFSSSSPCTFVLNASMFTMEDFLRELYPKADFVYCETSTDAFQMIAEGKADVTYEDKIIALWRLQNPRFSNLCIYEAYSYPETMYLVALREENPLLLSILQKALSSVTNQELNDIIVVAMNSSIYTYSASELLYRYRWQLSIAVVVLLLLITLLVITGQLRKRYRKLHEKQLLLTKQQEADRLYQKELYRQANFNQLSGLYNEQGFCSAVRKRLDADKEHPYVLLRCDIDHYKLFSDVYGVAKSNQLIKYLGKLCTKYAEKSHGIIGHLGEDDFVAFLPTENFSPEQANDLFQQWLSGFVSGYKFVIYFGIYLIDEPDIDVKLMIGRASFAMKAAKANGTAYYAYYDVNLKEKALLEQEIVQHFSTAMKENQFRIYLQPQYESSSLRIIGAEALVRWFHPVKGMISPADFIPVLEENGLITELDLFVIEEVCKILSAYLEEVGLPEEIPPISIAVNLSRTDTYYRELPQKLISMLNAYHIPPSMLRLEITESAFVEQPEQIASFVGELKRLGFHIEMDDFGSGYSSLNSLKDLPMDTLKLDMRFLSGTSSERGNIIIHSVISMAKLLNLPVIAEGVETAEQAEYLKSIGCNYLQGYFFAKPMPIQEFLALLPSRIIV